MFISSPAVCTLQLDNMRRDTTKDRVALAKKFLAQMLPLLSHLHDSGYVHCDLKLENVMESCMPKNFYILDLGFVSPSHSSGQLPCLYGGTAEYQPPATLVDPHSEITPSGDM